MKINSCAITVETPEKSESTSLKSPKLNEDSTQRLCPSKELSSALQAVQRFHIFCHSNQINSIEDMKLDLKVRNCIRDLFAGFDEDLDDWIIEKEERFTESKHFTSFLRDYIHLEFYVQKEHSFSVLVLLNYIRMFKLTPEIAFAEVFNLSLKETFCEQCSTNDINELYVRNLKYLRTVLNSNSDIDDSVGDPDYDETQRKDESSSDEFSNEVDSQTGRQTETYEKNLKQTCMTKQKMTANPFVDSDEDDVYVFNDLQEYGVNPFALSDEDEVKVAKSTKAFAPQKMSSVKDNQNKTNQCDHCPKTFGSRYNLNLHLIQVHRIFPPKMTIFQCQQCTFVTGNKVLYSRHEKTHSRKTKSKVAYLLTPYLEFKQSMFFICVFEQE